jgi:hypothetical protein
LLEELFLPTFLYNFNQNFSRLSRVQFYDLSDA